MLSALLQTLTIDDINEPDNDGMTALHWAAFHNRSEQVQLLMLRGADIYITDVDEKTPLHWASQVCIGEMGLGWIGGIVLQPIGTGAAIDVEGSRYLYHRC